MVIMSSAKPAPASLIHHHTKQRRNGAPYKTGWPSNFNIIARSEASRTRSRRRGENCPNDHAIGAYWSLPEKAEA